MQWEAIEEYYAEECDQKYCLKNLLWLLWAEWIGSGGTVAVVQGEMTVTMETDKVNGSKVYFGGRINRL